MLSPLTIAVEAAPATATVYLTGALSDTGALRVVDFVHELPAEVRVLRVDMAALRLFDVTALEAVLLVLECWRRRRNGTLHVVTPRGFVPDPDQTRRVAAVTDPLQFRAEVETGPMQSSGPLSLTSEIRMLERHLRRGRSARMWVLAVAAMLSMAGVLRPHPVLAQQQATADTAAGRTAGRIVGRIVDAQSGQGLSDVGIQIVGTTLGTSSGVDGRYMVKDIPAGTVTIQVRRLGYAPKTVTGVLLAAGQTLQQDIAMATATVTLQAQVVTALAEKGSVSKALDEQRTSTAIVNATTAEQIAKSPDSDAAQAVRRVSGVTVQDGKYVFVRGLGERYTQTSLNGARVPSPEPERKVVPLDLFPAALIEGITTSKTFTPDQPGDFSGASVDIRTRDFPARRTMTVSASSGMNSAATGKDVIAAPKVGSEWLGFSGSKRSLPGVVESAGDLRTITPGSPTNALVNSFRDVWSADTRSGAANGSFGFSFGGEDAVLGKRLGYIVSSSYSYSQEVRAGERSTVPKADGNGGAEPLSSFAGSTGRTGVLWGGLANVSTWLGSRSRISLNNTYNRSADNEARQLRGFDEQWATDVDLTRLSFIERSVLSNQLRGEHVLGSRSQVDWTVTRSAVTRDEPDRSDLVYWEQQSGSFEWKGGANDATRSFSTLDERDLSGGLNYRLSFDALGQRALKVGGFARDLHRDSDARSYDIINLSLDRPQLLLPAEEIFQRFGTGSATNFLMRTSTFGGRYTADEALTAGYAMLELPIGEQLRVVAGARVEQSDIDVRSRTPQGLDTTSSLRNTDVLPALSLTYALGEQMNFRVSATQTLSRPEYRELSPIAYNDVGGNDEERGNPGLVRALIQNYDARWEWYPGNGEVVSVGFFAKRFTDPIERVFRATTGKPQIGFENAKGAKNYGVELDLRKTLSMLGTIGTPFTFFSNVTLMRSRIELDETQTIATNPERAMAGQAPYVVNTGLSYSSESGRLSATALYNVVGKRIVLAGVDPLPDTYEMPRDVVDLSLQFPLLGALSGRVNATNLLDSPYVERTGDLTRRRYRMGRVMSFGVSWRP
jgi:outer membrane receptor protein involved in Fe transport